MIIQTAGSSALPVLIQGAVGTHKGVVARRIHTKSATEGTTLMRLQCRDLTEKNWDMLLNNAASPIHATGYTVYLENVDTLPKDLQQQVGTYIEDTKMTHRHRVISSSCCDLSAEVARGQFSSRLYLQLSGFTINVPSLAQRKEDIPAFVNMMIPQYNTALAKSTVGMEPDAMELMVELGVTDVILAFGLLGMILGSLAAMRENHIKRMLAYSSVAQVGYIFMGVGLGSIEGLIASCFHILVHACCKPLLFLCAGRLSAVSGHHKSLKNLRGSAYRDIGAGLGFTVGALSMIGIPLFGGFVSKLYFASAAVPTGMTAMILLTIALSTVLNALYYVPALLAIWVKPPAEDEALVLADVHPGDLAADRAFTAAAAILIVGIFVLGIFYHPITDLIEAGVRLI